MFPGMLVSQFAATWDMFMKIKLPAFLHAEPSDLETIDGKPALAVPMMPLCGAAAGFCLVVPLWAVAVLGRPLAAGILGATVVPLIVETLTGGSELRALSSFFEARRQGLNVEEALDPQSAGTGAAADAARNQSMFLRFTLYFLRMIMFGIIAYFGAAFWYVVVFTGAFFVRAELGMLNVPGKFGETPYLPVPGEMKKYHFYITLAVMTAAGFLTDIPFTLIGFLIAWLVAWLAKGICLEALSGINARAIRVFGYGAEIVLLFLGVLLYAKPA